MPFDGTAFVDKASTETSRETEAFPASPPPASPVLLLLRRAREMIAEPERWARGRYEADDERYCAIGALRAASRHLGDADALKRAHRMLLQIAIRRGYQSVERMNDESAHHHVISALGEAIRKAECDRLLPAYLR